MEKSVVIIVGQDEITAKTDAILSALKGMDVKVMESTTPFDNDQPFIITRNELPYMPTIHEVNQHPFAKFIGKKRRKK